MSYYSDNRDRLLAYQHAYYAANQEARQDYQREYARDHPLTTEQRRAKRWKRRSGGDDRFSPKDIRAQIELQQGLCRFCCQELEDYHADHFVPIARDGTGSPDNLCISCPSCNISRGPRLYTEWSPPTRVREGM